MSDRFTEQARRALYFARYEAVQAGSPIADAEHVLLGILAVESSLLNVITGGIHMESVLIRQELGVNPAGERPLFVVNPPPWSQDVRLLLERFAPEESEKTGATKVGVEHLFLALFSLQDSHVVRFLNGRGLTYQLARERLLMAKRKRSADKRKEDAAVSLEDFTQDLTRAARKNELDPLVGREAELERLIQILSRRQKNNPILLGEPGVGKTAIVEGLAQWIVEGRVPKPLKGRRLLSLDLSLVIAGTKYRGQFEERLKGILKEILEEGDVIIFIDEIHTLVGAGSAEGSLDAVSILKPALSRGRLQCIGTSTFRDYKRNFERDRSLVRRFQPISVQPPDEEESFRILQGLQARYENYHKVVYTPEALSAAVKLSNRYIADRFLPDKAVDVLDEAGARAKVGLSGQVGGDLPAHARAAAARAENAPGSGDSGTASQPPDEGAESRPLVVDHPFVEEVVAQWTGIPVKALREDEREKLLRIEETLHRRVIGQHEAISALARAIRRSRAGIKNPLRPIGSFVFLGPTGVGKTESARALSEFLFGDEKALIRFDMSEYMEKHSVAKMIGSPPGYVGYEEGGLLVEKVKRRPYSVVLMDEVEKAHPDVLNLLLQIMEDGILTDSYGDTVDFKNTILILTSNIGSKYILDRGSLGFEAQGSEHFGTKKDEVLRELRRVLLPEFINRIDEVIVFDSLTRDEYLKIAAKMIDDLNGTLRESNVRLEAGSEVLDFLVDRCCSDPTYGARPLRRGLQRYVEDLLANWMLKHSLQEPTTLVLEVRDEDIVLGKEDLVPIS
ncbi:MAG: ATP-dependent Clp protease ATP-binding subunit [Acidobacteriota bacterium]